MSIRSGSRFFWPALLLPLGVWASEAPPTPMCGNEHLPRLNPSRAIVCALDHGIARDTDTDQGDNIRAALSRLARHATGLFFPQGRYLVGGTIELGAGNALVGSRAGATHFINPADAVTMLKVWGSGLLVEGLVLDNMVVHVSGTGAGNVVRYTGIRQTKGGLSQLTLLGPGAHRAIGNVLWLEPGNEGGGIRLSDVRHGVLEGNQVGSANATGLSERTRALDRRMATLPLRDGHPPSPVAAAGRHNGYGLVGHLVQNTLIRGNRFGASIRLVASEQVTVQGNHFGRGTQGMRVGLSLAGTVDSWVIGNTFQRAALDVDLGEHHGKVNTWGPYIVGNWFLNTPVRVEQTGGPLKAATELVLIGNRFKHPAMPCAIEAVDWSVPEHRFLVADNASLSDGAWACHARGVGLDEARDQLSRKSGDMTAPAIPFGLRTWQVGNEVFELRNAEGAAPHSGSHPHAPERATPPAADRRH